MWHIVRRVEKRHRGDNPVEEASIGLDLSAFIGTANLFFTGLVILNLSNLPSVVQLPVVYLVVSAVSFIISSVIYANISGMHRQSVLRDKMMRVANWVSEYPGIYLFLIAIPLVILGVTTDFIVQLATAFACYGALILYSVSPYSLDHRRFQGGLDRFVNTFFLTVFVVGIYVLAITNSSLLLICGVIGLAILLALSFGSLSFRMKK